MDRPKIFTQADEVTNADSISRLSLSDVLHVRDRPLTLFTPALLITHGGFDRDPVVEFDARFPADNKDDRPFFTEVKDPQTFFNGLGSVSLPNRKPVAWNRRLYCIAKERAEECFSFIGGIAFSNPKTGFFANVFSYDIVIPDPTSDRGQQLDVKIFGVIANSFIAMLETRLGQPPAARKLPMSSPAAANGFLRGCGIFTTLTDDDPLTMRD